MKELFWIIFLNIKVLWILILICIQLILKLKIRNNLILGIFFRYVKGDIIYNGQKTVFEILKE